MGESLTVGRVRADGRISVCRHGSIAFSKRLGAGLLGGEGFVLERLRGDGLAFVHAGGAIMPMDLAGETLHVDTGCIVGFENGIDYDVGPRPRRRRLSGSASALRRTLTTSLGPRR